jgi:hypothetical protein
MADVERFTPDDRRGVELLYRRTLGIEASDRLRLRWDWARRNPAAGGVEPPNMVGREGPTVIAACPLMPVRVSMSGREIAGTWSGDPIVTAERQRQGLGGALLRAWDRATGVALGAGLSDATRGRLDEMRWPRGRALPCLVKPISRRAFRRPAWPVAVNRLVSALTLPVVRVVARARPLREEMEVVRRFDAGADRLWERLAARFGLVVRRDAQYLNWKFIEPPHVRYTTALLKRGGEMHGYVVYRHLREPQGKVTQIVDLLADPADERGLKTLARWVDREARAADSDKIRCFATHGSVRRVLRRSGYFVIKSALELTVKVNAVEVPRRFYESLDDWHFTLGDNDLDH